MGLKKHAREIHSHGYAFLAGSKHPNLRNVSTKIDTAVAESMAPDPNDKNECVQFTIALHEMRVTVFWYQGAGFPSPSLTRYLSHIRLRMCGHGFYIDRLGVSQSTANPLCKLSRYVLCVRVGSGANR